MEYIDLSEEQITKRQHFVPKAYLKEFSFDKQKTPHVYAVFPKSKESVSVSIEKICCQSYLYDQIAIDPDSGAHVFVAPNELERFFSAIEGRYAAIISKLTSDLHEKNDFELTVDEIGMLRGFLSSLVWRNPIFVHISNCIVDKLYNQDPEYIERIRNAFPDMSPNLFVSNLANENLKAFLLSSTLAMAETMENSKICILRAQGPLLVTSDMPVVNMYGEEHGIKYDLMGMPITPNLFLTFIDTDHPVPKVVTVGDCQVKRINGRQVVGARQLLISNSDKPLSYIDFSFEHEKQDVSWLCSMLHIDKETALREYHEIMVSKEIKYWK